MRVSVTVVQQGTEPQDVLLNLEEDASVAEVARALSPTTTVASAVVTPLPGVAYDPRFDGVADTPVLWADGQRCDPDARVRDVLRDGMRISVDDAVGPYLRAGEPSGDYELRVVGGPGAGRVARLAVGVTTLGSADRCTITVPDTQLPHEALRVTIAADGGVMLAPRDTGVPVLLDNEPVVGEREWPRDALVKCGASLFALDTPVEPDAHLAPMGEGGLAYNRPPRLNPLPPRARLVAPRSPTKAERARFQLLATLTPLVLGLVMYLMTKQVYTLLFCLMSPVMMAAEWVSQNREGKKKNRTSLKQYKEEKAVYEAELARLTAADRQARRTAFPDAAAMLLFATGPRRRLWERRITDPDALQLRVGVSDLPADIELALAPGVAVDEAPPTPPLVHDVPVTLPFTHLGVVGLAGARPQALATARWLATQAAVLHSPRDLSLVVLSSIPDAGQVWSWAHWLPHAAPQQGQDCLALVGSDNDTIARRVNELLGELNRRKTNAEQHTASASLRPDPYVLIVLDGARLLRRVPGVPQLLQEGPLYGMYALCLDEDERLLPEECRAAICWPAGSADRILLRGSGLEMFGEVLADQVTQPWCELVARSLAPVRDVSRDDADSGLPLAARLLTLLGMPDPTGADIERIWRAGGSTTRTPIGVSADGTFFLDIRTDGPHGLIAGTTGAGKSELLQTIITSLAVHNRPDALNFVLIDYKGGSAFQDCERLPHTVGMVSDLDAHLTERALASLAAELRRREEILLRARTKDIEDYTDNRRLHPDLEPMPRLLLVIDEFASLVAELPDFVEGLVDIARRGRSLGVHLILATQRPAGVVSADIRANTNLRIALRVTNGDESADVIDAPDAGAISKATPGRMYVRSGAQALVAVQSARIGGRRPGQSSRPQVASLPMPWSQIGRPLPKTVDDGDDGTMRTDLAVLVDAMAAAAKRMGFGKPHSPWLPPLPSRVTVAELYERTDPGHGDVAPAVFGVIDVPARQTRMPLALDLAGGEHLMIVGGPRSGRSSTLRTIAASLAMAASPSDVHLYGVDCGANILLPLAKLPHCGGIVTRDESDRLVRLLGRLQAEVTRRQQLLAHLGVSGVAEQRTATHGDQRLPWMVLLLDGWEGYTSTFESYDYGKLIEAMTRLFREGPSVGLRIVMTTDRSGLIGPTASSFGDRLILRLTDPNDYAMAGLTPREIPKDMPPGRAMRLTEHGAQECQIALLAPDPAGKAQVETVQQIARESHQVYPRPPKPLRPMRVDALPTRVTAREALALEPDFQPPADLWALVGVGGDELAPVGVDLSESGPGFVIAGPPKSGRSTTLITMARCLTRSGIPVALITPKRSPLRDLAGEEGVLGVLGAEATGDELNELLAAAPAGRYAVVVDDAELLYEAMLGTALEEVLRTGLDGDHAVIAAGSADAMTTQYHGFLVEARRNRQGLLLSPSPDSGEQLFGIRLPRNVSGGPAGRGLLIAAGTTTPVQAVIDS